MLLHLALVGKLSPTTPVFFFILLNRPHMPEGHDPPIPTSRKRERERDPPDSVMPFRTKRTGSISVLSRLTVGTIRLELLEISPQVSLAKEDLSPEAGAIDVTPSR